MGKRRSHSLSRAFCISPPKKTELIHPSAVCFQQAEAANCTRYKLSEKQLRAVRRVGLRLPHECRETTAAQKEAAAIEEEDVLFEDGISLESMFSALRTDDKFMGR